MCLSPLLCLSFNFLSRRVVFYLFCMLLLFHSDFLPFLIVSLLFSSPLLFLFCADYECITQLEGHEHEVKCVSWYSSGRFVATCSRDKAVWIWEGLTAFIHSPLHPSIPTPALTKHPYVASFCLWFPFLGCSLSSSSSGSFC